MKLTLGAAQVSQHSPSSTLTNLIAGNSKAIYTQNEISQIQAKWGDALVCKPKIKIAHRNVLSEHDSSEGFDEDYDESDTDLEAA